MVDLISTIQQESDATFSLRLMNANADTREELLSMRDGMKNREAFMQSKQGKAVFFDTTAEAGGVVSSGVWHFETDAAMPYDVAG